MSTATSPPPAGTTTPQQKAAMQNASRVYRNFFKPDGANLIAIVSAYQQPQTYGAIQIADGWACAIAPINPPATESK